MKSVTSEAHVALSAAPKSLWLSQWALRFGSSVSRTSGPFLEPAAGPELTGEDPHITGLQSLLFGIADRLRGAPLDALTGYFSSPSSFSPPLPFSRPRSFSTWRTKLRT